MTLVLHSDVILDTHKLYAVLSVCLNIHIRCLSVNCVGVVQ